MSRLTAGEWWLVLTAVTAECPFCALGMRLGTRGKKDTRPLRRDYCSKCKHARRLADQLLEQTGTPSPLPKWAERGSLRWDRRPTRNGVVTLRDPRERPVNEKRVRFD